jgi:hypothetical protein
VVDIPTVHTKPAACWAFLPGWLADLNLSLLYLVRLLECSFLSPGSVVAEEASLKRLARLVLRDGTCSLRSMERLTFWS